MSDSKLPPRYVGYPRPNSLVAESAVARLVQLVRFGRTTGLLSVSMAMFATLRLVDMQLVSPLHRAASVVFLIAFSAGTYWAFAQFAALKECSRMFGILPAGMILLMVPFILQGPTNYALGESFLIIGFAYLWALPGAMFANAEIKRNGFSAWRQVYKEIKRVQTLERQTFVPPIPENLYSGEPPNVPRRRS